MYSLWRSAEGLWKRIAPQLWLLYLVNNTILIYWTLILCSWARVHVEQVLLLPLPFPSNMGFQVLVFKYVPWREKEDAKVSLK